MLDRDHLGVLDIHAARNAVRSSAALVEESGRARRRARRAAARSVHPPLAEQVGPPVQVLTAVEGHPVAVR